VVVNRVLAVSKSAQGGVPVPLEASRQERCLRGLERVVKKSKEPAGRRRWKCSFRSIEMLGLLGFYLVGAAAGEDFA